MPADSRRYRRNPQIRHLYEAPNEGRDSLRPPETRFRPKDCDFLGPRLSRIPLVHRIWAKRGSGSVRFLGVRRGVPSKAGRQLTRDLDNPGTQFRTKRRREYPHGTGRTDRHQSTGTAWRKRRGDRAHAALDLFHAFRKALPTNGFKLRFEIMNIRHGEFGIGPQPAFHFAGQEQVRRKSGNSFRAGTGMKRPLSQTRMEVGHPCVRRFNMNDLHRFSTQARQEER